MVRRLALSLLASSALVPGVALAQSASAPVLPTGGQVAAGAATIAAPQGGAMHITQSSDRAIINWQGFSIGEGGRVDIRQPSAQSALLNRVTGNATSEIAGQLNANGRVFLVNPNGILITKTGSVNAAGFAASTLDVSDRDFMAGTDELTVLARRGQAIGLAEGGYAGLLGGRSADGGLIRARVSQANGQAALDVSGDGFMQVGLSGAGIAVAGTINAGEVVLRAGTAREAARQTVNLSGTINATGIDTVGGTVVLTGAAVELADATIDASGKQGGGTVAIGGGYQGGGMLAHADTLTVDAATTIRADATGTGDGGRVVLWSDDATRFAGAISARGAGGLGGDAEVSGKAWLDYRGTADLTGTRFGTLLLDPYNVTISNGAGTGTGFTATGNDSVINAGTLLTALKSANVTVSTGASGTQNGDITLASGTNLSWTSGATLTLSAAGAITLNGNVNAAAGGLTIEAGSNSTATATGDISVARFTLNSGDWVQNNATLPGFVAGDFRVGGGSFLRAAGGDGTSGNPYLIRDVYGLQGIGTYYAYRQGNFKLAGDIDASGTQFWNDGAGFNPIGSQSGLFFGSLSGAGYAVSGLTIDRPDTDNVGLIGYMDTGSTVSDIGLIGGSTTGKSNVGSLVGSNNFGEIARSYSTGTVTAAENAGGLIGFNRGMVSQSYASGSTTSVLNAGGLVGYNINGTIRQSYATGSVVANSNAGGLVGYANSVSLNEVYATGAVSGTTTGGLIGRVGGASLLAYYWDTQSTGQSSAFGNSNYSSGGLTSSQARSASSYGGFDFTNVWYQAGDLRPILRSEAVKVGGVYQISNLHQLQLMGADLSGSYVLTRDIDAGATVATATSSGIFGAGGFAPVGDTNIYFGGSLDGAHHVITGLTIARSSQTFSGLFGAIDTSGRVSNVGIVNSDVTGGDYVGGLASYNRGTITGSYVTGDITGTQSVGGLVGYSTGTISQSYAVVSVAAGDNAGGLVGYGDGDIIRSHASGIVSATGYYVGGLVGRQGSHTITQSYSTATVSGDEYVGGLIGYSSAGTVSQSYATGRISGASNLGGFIGKKEGLTNSYNNYWDTNSTGLSIGATGSVAGMTGLTSAQARNGANYTGFNFTTDWYQTGDMRPILRSEAVQVNGVYQISNLHQLQLMGADLAGSYALTGDIDASATASTATSSGIFGTGGFVPVGDDTDWFSGSLNGAGYKISGLKISRSGQANVGLIGGLGTNGSIYDVDVVGSSVSGGRGTGGLVGVNAGTIKSSSYAGTVIGNNYTGGLVGSISTGASVISSYSTASVTGGYAAGGLVGSNSGTIRQSYATGSVSGSGQYAGGLVAMNQGTLMQVYATGQVSGTNGVGGLIGTNSSIVTEAYATGQVSGTSMVGGLFGSGGGRVTSAYWNVETTNQSNAAGSGSMIGGSGLTTAQMQDLSNYRTNFAGFDFDTVWAPPNQVGQGGLSTAYYPELFALSKVLAVGVSASRAYGEASAPVANYLGVRAGDFVTTLGTAVSSVTATSNAGSYAATISGSAITGPNAGYRTVYVPGTLTVTPRAITVTADAKSRVYGDANPALTYSIGGAGLVNGNSLSGALATMAGTASSVGTYAIGQGDLSASSNYALTFVGADLSITKRAITVTADAQSRPFGSDNPTLTYSIGGAGLVNGDSLSGALTSADRLDRVGSYSILRGSLNASSNYDLSYTGADLTVIKRAITVTANSQSRMYGSANPTLTYSVGGLGLVDGVPLVGALATTAVASSNVGTYAIEGGSLTTSYYYDVSFTGANLAITPRSIIVTADAKNRVYGDANPALTYSIGGAGLIIGDTLSGALSTMADTASNVGAYSIGQGDLSASSNYALSFVGADLSVTKRAITVTADAKSRIYGDANPALTYTVGGPGLIGSDTLTGALAVAANAASGVGAYGIDQGDLTAGGNYDLSFTGADLTVAKRAITVTTDAQSRAYGDANPTLTYTVGGLGLVNGDSLTGAMKTSADTSSGIGTYLISRSNLTAGGNYDLSFTGADLTVTKRAITVTVDAKSRAYGDANTALTYTVGGMGLVNGDEMSGALATAANAVSSVGSYSIDMGTLSAGGNYDLNYTGADLSVTKRAITIAPDAKSRVYGGTNPKLTYTVGGAGLVNGDALSGALATTADGRSGVGNYAIQLGTVDVGGNYDISLASADLTITPREISVQADPQNRIYGEAGSALTYTVAGMGLVNGDTLTGNLSTTANALSNVGTYTIAVGDLAASSNYTVTFTGANLTVTPRSLTVTADSVTRAQNLDNPALTYTLGGGGLVNGDILSGALSTAADRTSAMGSYAIEQGTLAASANYSIDYMPGVLTVEAGANPVAPATSAARQARDAFARETPNGIDTDTLAVSESSEGVVLSEKSGGDLECLRTEECGQAPRGEK